MRNLVGFFVLSFVVFGDVQALFGSSMSVLKVGLVNLKEKTIKVDKFVGKCPEYKTLPIVYEEMSIVPNDEGQLKLNMTIVVHEDVPGPLRMEMRIERCEGKNRNNCEQLHTFRSRRYCDMIVSESDFTWRQLFQAIRPKWQCPIKKGTYRAVNGAFDITTFMLMASERSSFKIRSETFNSDGKTVLCVMGEGHVELQQRKK